MKILGFLLVTFSLFSFPIVKTKAALLAVVDSGIDISHPDLASQVWVNPDEIPGNDFDEDGNGYKNDLYGWNFLQGNAELIDGTQADCLTDDIRRFYVLKSRRRVSKSDLAWIKKQSKDRSFVRELGLCTDFIHGTYITGLAMRGRPLSRFLTVRFTGRRPEVETEILQRLNFLRSERVGRDEVMSNIFHLLVEKQITLFDEVGTYLRQKKVDVVNGSFGTDYRSIHNMIFAHLEDLGRLPHPKKMEKTIRRYARSYLKALVQEAEQRLFTVSPQMLFVFAAGNYGRDNDRFPTYPANAKGENVLTVAAVGWDGKLASLSNFGRETVDIGAPGMALTSCVPGGGHLTMNGTSPAAAYVSNVALAIKELNPTLMGGGVKRIIMETVDVEKSLRGKVLSSGVVNKARAIKAAELLSLGESFESAIAAAHKIIGEPFRM